MSTVISLGRYKVTADRSYFRIDTSKLPKTPPPPPAVDVRKFTSVAEAQDVVSFRIQQPAWLPTGFQFDHIRVWPMRPDGPLMGAQEYRATDRRLLITQEPVLTGTHLVPGPLIEVKIAGQPAAIFQWQARNALVRACIMEREDSLVRIDALGLVQEELVKVAESLK